MAEVRAIAELQTTCWREAYADLVPRAYLDGVGADDRVARWRDRIVTGARGVALGKVGGELSGVVSWATSDVRAVRALEFARLYVAARDRGTGIAAALLTYAMVDSSAHLWVFEGNPRAAAFYAMWGFGYDGHRMIDCDTGIWLRRYLRRWAGGPVIKDRGDQ